MGSHPVKDFEQFDGLEMLDEAQLANMVFRTGVVLSPDFLVVLAGVRQLDETKTRHSMLLTWRKDQGWKGGLEDWLSSSMCRCARPREGVAVLGSQGEVATLSLSDRFETKMGEGEVVASIGAVGGRPYIAGMSGKIWREMAPDDWQVVPLDGTNVEPDFESVAGRNDANFVAVGWDGAIYAVENGVSEFVDSLTNVILTSVCLGGDGYYYACGQRGLLLRGRGANWEIIEHEATDEDLWNVAWFQGKLYVSSMIFVYELNSDGTLDPIDMQKASGSSAYHFDVLDDSYLLSVGEADIALFDGKEWMKVF